jgi:23S rRNA (adenine2503-C2)-methyltransferase
MEVYKTKDGLVTKYVHDDGSETAIKTVSSCGNVLNKITGEIGHVDVDREKFSVFISSSVGCPIGCKFCYLTIKKYPYRKLSGEEIFNNFKEAITHALSENPALRKKYIKLSWMGMGDPMLRDPYELRRDTIKFIKFAVGDKGIFGLDGVDIGTVLPPCRGWQHQLGTLDDYLRRYRCNPNNVGKRSRVRIFYSLHSSFHFDRMKLIPIVTPYLNNSIEMLKSFNEWYNIDVILHHMFLDKVNDFDDEIKRISTISKNTGFEVRILRYNECENSPYKESKRFDEILKLCGKHLPKVKYQVSAGSEIKASCGQFLCKSTIGR